MSELDLYRAAPGLPARAQRQTNRVALQYQRQASREMARLEAQAAVNRASDRLRVDRVAEVAERGMIQAVRLSAVEATCTEIAPHAAGRIKLIADTAAIGIAGAVHRAGL